MTPYEILTAAQELIRDPAKWTQGTNARSKFNRPVDANSAKACKWCAIGAIEKTAGETLGTAGFTLRASFELGDGKYSGTSDFNDHSTHADVMRLFDLARKKAKAAEAA